MNERIQNMIPREEKLFKSIDEPRRESKIPNRIPKFRYALAQNSYAINLH